LRISFPGPGVPSAFMKRAPDTTTDIGAKPC
jgi:hypothetical protein